MKHDSDPGNSHPLGATLRDGGPTSSLFSRSATRVELLFFDRADDARPRTEHRIGSMQPPDLPLLARLRARGESGQLYGYRVHGPSEPTRGLRFDPGKVLLDPYGRGRGAHEVQSRGGRTSRRQCRHCHEERRGGSGPPTTGKAMPRCAARRRGRSFTRCTSAASPATRVPAWRRRSAARTPA